MKNLFLFSLICAISLVFALPVHGATATPSAAQDLLDRVATKVATLASKLRRVYTGKIKSVGTRSIVITTFEGDRTVSTNDVTSFFRLRAGSRTEINFNALKAGDDIAAIGTVDPNTFEMTAKQIIAKVKRYNVVGEISEVSKTIYSVAEIGGPTTKVDLSDALSLKQIGSVSGQITTTGMSSFKPGNLIFVIGYLADSQDNSLSVLKALRLEK